MNVFPVGHYVGERHPDQLHLVRLGPAHQTLTADEFGVWILAHGVTESRSWTVADVLAPSLWQACEVRAKVGAGLGDPTSAADLLDDVLGDLRPLLANSCAYLDVIRRR